MKFTNSEESYIDSKLVVTASKRNIKHLFNSKYTYRIYILLYGYSYEISISYESFTERETDYDKLIKEIMDEKK